MIDMYITEMEKDRSASGDERGVVRVLLVLITARAFLNGLCLLCYISSAKAFNNWKMLSIGAAP